MRNLHGNFTLDSQTTEAAQAYLRRRVMDGFFHDGGGNGLVKADHFLHHRCGQCNFMPNDRTVALRQELLKRCLNGIGVLKMTRGMRLRDGNKGPPGLTFVP